MDSAVNSRRGETVAHARLKRLALLWVQTQGYSACAFEVTLPRSRYRADLVAYRPAEETHGSTAIFECKQARSDLRRDNACAEITRQRLKTVAHRRQVIEKHLRIHYPALRVADSLFSEFDSHDFAAIGHRGYARVLRELEALQNQLRDCTKFEKLIRYRCANLYFLVLSEGLFREHEIPFGWGALVERSGRLELACKPSWHETTAENCVRCLQRIAIAGTRALNRDLQITFDDVKEARCRINT